MVTNAPVFSLKNMSNGVCHKKLANNTTAATKLSVKEIGKPKNIPVVTTTPQNIRLIKSSSIVFKMTWEIHILFLLTHTENMPWRLYFLSADTENATIMAKAPGRIVVYHQLYADIVKNLPAMRNNTVAMVTIGASQSSFNEKRCFCFNISDFK